MPVVVAIICKTPAGMESVINNHLQITESVINAINKVTYKHSSAVMVLTHFLESVVVTVFLL